MPNETSFSASTEGASVTGKITDKLPVIPDTPPTGLTTIGPRVTIAPKGAWDASTSYEFYDAVFDGKGNSYIAKKPSVPAGTPVTDENYWTVWTPGNQQLAELQETVTTFDNRITANTTGLATEQKDRENAVNALDAIVETEDIICIGDSFGSGITGADTEKSTWGWLNYIASHKPKNVRNVYTNTSTVIAGNTGFTSTRTFLAVITDIVQNVIENPKTVKHVYITGGTNDHTAGAQAIINAIAQVAEYVRSNLPNADITIGYLATRATEAFQGYQTGATASGCRFENLLMIMSNPAYVTDGTHLSDTGYHDYVDAIIGKLLYGSDLATRYTIKFKSEDYANDFYGTDNASLDFETRAGMYTYACRTSGSPNLVVFKKDNYTSANSPQAIVNNATNYIANGAENIFIPCRCVYNGATSNNVLYYDKTDNTLKIRPTGFTISNGGIDIYVDPTRMTELYPTVTHT